MFEISLVPDVKSELIKKLKLRNLIFLICVIVAAACIGVLLILFGVTAGQGVALNAQDTEMACRSDGKLKGNGRCDSKFGTAIMKFNNAEELLTIQDQMKNISLLNSNKIKFSRTFGILDTIMSNKNDKNPGEDKVFVNTISADINNSTLYFDAIAEAANNIGYRALEGFKKNVTRTYYDYGNYMRTDSDGNTVPIPSYCITEVTDEKTKIMYGVYHKGAPGCEAPMIEDTNEAEQKDENETETEDEETNSEAAETESVETETEEKAKTEVKDIYIRRTYNNQSDREEYINGNNRYKREENEETIKGYYFDSQCLQYDGDGNFDEAATLEACPLLSEEPTIGDSSYGRDNEEKMVLSFSATLTISRPVFLSSNKHMMIVSPTRQNVTDSYIQVKNMFTEAAHDTEEGEEK